MQVKLFEVRDRMTFLSVFAISTREANQGQGYLLGRCGFESGDAVILGYLNGERNSSADAYHWNDRTMQSAHLYIEKHFYELNDGDVVDVEFILGETDKPKISERLGTYE